MKKVYTYNERELFLNEGLKAGLSQDEAERQVNEMGDLNVYKFELEEMSIGTQFKIWKNGDEITVKELAAYEKSYFHRALEEYRLFNIQMLNN